MTITRSVQQEFLDDENNRLICIPCRTSTRQYTDTAAAHAALNTRSGPSVQAPPTSATQGSRKGERWTEDEHERFLLGMEMFQAGPWKKIAGVVGTRDARQTMSHAQKYRQKIKRRKVVKQPPTHPQQQPEPQTVECTASTTKKRRTMTSTAAGGEAANRVVANAQSTRVSSTVQLSREQVADGLSVTSGLAQGSEHVSGLIATETVHAINLRSGEVSDPGTVSNVVVGADIDRGDLLNQRLDVTLEPLDIDVDISVMQDSWLGPAELWDFLQRPSRD